MNTIYKSVLNPFTGAAQTAAADAPAAPIKNSSSFTAALPGFMSPMLSDQTLNTSTASTAFAESNTIVAKIGFLILALFSFMIMLRVGVAILGAFFQKTRETVLIRGMVDAKQLKVIPQDPSASGAITINRSVNENDGIEFTWSCWIYVDDMGYNEGKYKCVFYKGNDYEPNPNGETPGLNYPNNAPGLYIAPHTNSLVILMNTFKVMNEEIVIRDLPINKWVNVIIRCKNTTMDVYINGTITKSHILHGVPKQNYGNVFVGMNGGFSGNISNLSYFNYALGTNKIAQLQIMGADTTMIGGEGGMDITTPDYLSLRWFI